MHAGGLSHLGTYRGQLHVAEYHTSRIGEHQKELYRSSKLSGFLVKLDEVNII
jgi:hypothetical protein